MYTEDVYEEFEQGLRGVTERCISQLGGYDDKTIIDFLDEHYRKVRKIFETVMADEIKRFHTHKPKRKTWPHNDRKLKVKKQFIEFYPALKRHFIDRRDEEGQAIIESAGGKPFCRQPDSNNKYGNVVIRCNIRQLMKDTGKSRETVFRRFRELTAAGVLIKLKTAGNESSLYVIGDWQMGRNGGYIVNERLNRLELREKIKAELIEQGLVTLI